MGKIEILCSENQKTLKYPRRIFSDIFEIVAKVVNHKILSDISEVEGRNYSTDLWFSLYF